MTVNTDDSCILSSECVGRDFVYYDGLCVMASTVKLNWYEARAYCENLDGHLLVLDSQQKLNDTKEFLQTYCMLCQT